MKDFFFVFCCHIHQYSSVRCRDIVIQMTKCDHMQLTTHVEMQMQFSAACQDYIPLIATPGRALVF